MLLPDEEPAFIKVAIEGDGIAIEALLLTHFTALERHIKPKIPANAGRHLAVEDILQDTFAHAFRDIASFDPDGHSFVAWLKGIADHRLADALRRLHRKKRGGDRHRLSAMGATASSIEQFVDAVCGDSITPGQLAAGKEAAQAIQVAIAALPEHERVVIWSRYIEHKSVAEIAAQTARTTGAVRGLIQRAKEKLRETMGRSSMWFSSR